MKNSSGCNRFAFIVSQKVSKKAVVRNKIRMVGGLERALLISEFIGDAVFIREPIIDDDVIILYFKLPQDGYGVVKINETYFKNKG